MHRRCAALGTSNFLSNPVRLHKRNVSIQVPVNIIKDDREAGSVSLRQREKRMLGRFQEITLVPILAGIVAFTSSSFVHSGESLTVLSIAAGGGHTCAVINDGTVRCWGNNRDGRMGNGTITEEMGVVVQVAGIKSARKIALGLRFSCASLAEGTVACWGDNEHGQLGNGTTKKALVPVVVTALHTATDVTAGFDHACALLKDGSISCWGRNDRGQLGNATQIASSIPVPVKGIATAIALTTGQGHTCALLRVGTVRCWGSNGLGELGVGTNTDALVPVDVTDLRSVTAIGLGNGFSCAVLADGRVKCWGENNIGQLGNGTRENSRVPVETTGITSAQKVDGGSLHACALLREGTVKCWGFNHAGQLGNGTQADLDRPVHEQGIPTPVEVIGLRSARDVTTGLMHSCALEGTTMVKCWGGNYNGGYFTKEVGSSASMPIVIPVVP